LSEAGSSDRLNDDAVARLVAEEAGVLLVELRQSMGSSDARLLRDEGDRRSHDLIMQRLAELRPDDAVLSEEGKDDLRRLESRRVWVVDPLDGTREFGEPPRDDWTVHVALCVDGIPVAGAVAMPARGTVYATGESLSAASATGRRPRIAASRTRAPALVAHLAEALDGEVVPMGSAGAKSMAVLTGEVDIYVHAGGQYEWDSAAPVAVAAMAGLHTSRIDGSPLLYNRADPYLPDLLICRQEQAAAVLDVLRSTALAETPAPSTVD
jgi:3'(2'), 5'-bisphosphate nucleotidase